MPTRPTPIAAIVAALLRQHYAECGRKGGSSKSPAKQAAAQRNGRRGGRPRKQKQTEEKAT